ncbi:hypothetical protein [Pseudomonas sp. RIT-PI-S]|uniref:hypothetical protein n=1 Tax=Pseudomonas sp. RIT-PI-S TaxID=3035295 RepID=UPI0021D8F635|nr:hypothetical protein [Pseudomonas sp. RIT-PI-S]
MEHSNQVGSYTSAHKSLMALLTDSVMAKLSRPEAPAAPAEPEATAVVAKPVETPVPSSFYFRNPGKRCGCDQCRAVRKAM